MTKPSEEMDPTSNLITTLKELKYAIEEGDINELKVKINWFYQDLQRNEQLLFELYKSGNQYVSQTELILTACRNKQVDILYYLLNVTDILDHFPGTDFSDPEVNSKRTEAFKLALIWDAFPMVEMLYDYWSGDLHWIGHDINKIITLRKLLEDACVVCIVETQQLLLDIHSLIKFNAFQQDLYSSISNISPENTVPMLVEMLKIYDNYSQLDKVRLPHEDIEQERMIQAYIHDSSDYMKIQAYIKYEIYFHKLDFNVALLILENLHVLRKYLKQRLKEPESYFAKHSGIISLYEQIECVLYNFIFRTCEDWRLYLPRNRQITKEVNHTGIHKGRINNNLIVTYDKHKLLYGPVLFLERKNYNKRLTELKNILLEKHIVSEVPANTEERQILLDENYLTSTMYMGGYYSLSKIVYYIKAIEDTENVNVLMIERVLQVIGELLKSNGESNHILDSTKVLLQMAVSVKTVQNLCNISNFLSRADEGQLSKRIDIARKQVHIFSKIKQDLKVMKQMIDTILDFYKDTLDKSLLEEGLRLLDERIKYLPDESSRHMDEIVQCFKIHGQELLVSRLLLQELTENTGLTTLCLKEMIWICVNRDDLLSKTNSTNESINKKLVSIFTTYIGNIRKTLEPIDENNKNLNSINPDLVKYNLEKVSQSHINDNLSDKQVDDFSHYNREAIGKMLSSFLDECKLLGPKSQVNLHALTETLLEELEKNCQPSSSKNLAGEHLFEGIEELHAIFQEHKPPKIVQEQLISSLINRVNQLKEILGYPQQILEENLRRYKHDLQFRFELEMVLADIANVFNTYDIKRIMNKSGKLLRDIDLGNVLNHGNPFLEVLGNVFDSTDLSTALLSKAISFAEDGESIEALYKLLQHNIDYEIIKKGKLEAMTDEQVKLYKKIQTSPNWENYARLQFV